MKFLERSIYIFYFCEIWQVSMCFHFVEKQTETQGSWELSSYALKHLRRGVTGRQDSLCSDSISTILLHLTQFPKRSCSVK